MAEITLDQAKTVLDAAHAAAQSSDLLMNIAVVDSHGLLTAFVRMDGAWKGSADIAMTKARSSALFDMESGSLGEASQPGGPLFNIELSNGGLISFPGGIPLQVDGVTVGAVGVSGSTVENDRMVAQAGVAAFGS